ncbi:MAG: sensor histidine kinase [Gemmataceae bacterium]
MKSIRLSLMVYFLALLVVALTAASLLVYGNAEQTLQEKQTAMEKGIESQYLDRCNEENKRLDEELLAQAQTLAKLAQVQFDWSRRDLQPLYLLGLSSALNPSGYVTVPTWLAEGWPPQLVRTSPPPPERQERPRREHPTAVWIEFAVRFLSGVKLKDRPLFPGENQAGYYFQVDHLPGKPYHSNSMAGFQDFRLDENRFRSDQLVSWGYDDYQLDRKKKVRRVVFKASDVGMVDYWLRSPSTPSGRSENAEGGKVRPGLTIYVHCAAETDKRDAMIAQLTNERNDKFVDLKDQTENSLLTLRYRLLAISLAVFAATAIGSFWLVRFGLMPLQRLSHAVSRVSVKDFRLPLGEQPLPLELRPIAERLTTTLNLLKRAFAREKQSVADISHELRTPLAALMTTTEFALRKPRAPEQYRELLGDVHASAQQMNQIVERLLTLARLDAGVDRLRLQKVDAADLAQQCAAVIRPLAEARGLRLTVKSPPPASSFTKSGGGGDNGCLVQTDPDKLREIVTNLLHNAIQYNRTDGAIDLRVARHNGTLQVEVQDSGIGIAAEAREHIFERFYRVDPSRGGDDLHAGLGLAIVKEYIDLMGGTIGVESTEGQGSTFRVVLPVH